MYKLKAMKGISITLVILLSILINPYIAYGDTGNLTYDMSENESMTSELINGEEETTIPEEVGVTVTGISLDQPSVALTVGESLMLVPGIHPIEANNKNISWTSSNTMVVTVDATGRITAISEGNGVITVTTEDGGYTATCDVHVYKSLAIPGDEYGVPSNYDAVTLYWSKTAEATGYEVLRSTSLDGEYKKVAAVQAGEYKNTGLKTGTEYYYKIRAYQTAMEGTIYSDYTSAITVKTLDKTIGSSLFLYMSELRNRTSVYAKAVALHYGDPHNTCAITVSEALRRLGMNIPTSTNRTNQVDGQLLGRGYQRKMDLSLLQPGDICFTTDAKGNLLGGHATHVFIFMGWANKEKTLMNICDNQVYTYGSVLHTRTIFRSKLTDATAFFYHTELSGVDSILKIPAVKTTSVDYNKVKITWNKSANAYGYQVFRASSKSGIYVKIGSTRSTGFTDTALVNGKTYYYKVRAYNNVGTTKIFGNYSAVYTATPKLTAPSSVTKSSVSGKVKLTWKKSTSAHGYQIYRSTSKNGTYTKVATTSHTYYTNSGLKIGKEYYYKVRAYRYVGKTKVYSNYSYLSAKVL